MSVLELRDVTKSFGGVRAVNRASIGFDRGRITGLIGPNGAGKTTIFNLISGFLRPDDGIIQCRGTTISRLRPWQIAAIGVGRLFQDVHLFSRLTVIDNVMAAFLGQSGENPVVSVFGRWVVARQERVLRERATKLLEFVGIAGKADDLAEDLSFGQQKLLSIARLLAGDAEILLLDEPTAGVNPQMIAVLLDVIRRLATDGKTVVFIEHNMNVVIEIADMVYFLDNGQVASFGTPADVLGDPEVRKAYIGV
jgi:ABC-type branched-subunit amino acid transport system ATPase component